MEKAAGLLRIGLSYRSDSVTTHKFTEGVKHCETQNIYFTLLYCSVYHISYGNVFSFSRAY